MLLLIEYLMMMVFYCHLYHWLYSFRSTNCDMMMISDIFGILMIWPGSIYRLLIVIRAMQSSVFVFISHCWWWPDCVVGNHCVTLLSHSLEILTGGREMLSFYKSFVTVLLFCDATLLLTLSLLYILCRLGCYFSIDYSLSVDAASIILCRG